MTVIPVALPDFTGNEKKYLNECIDTGWVSSQGRFVDLFERQFSEWSSSPYAVSCSNGTTALHLALVALGIGPGDEVIVPDLTFASTVNAVLHAGATPVLVDVELGSWCICPHSVIKNITERTKAIIAVHLYGQVADMSSLSEICKERRLLLIEDCAEALGATCLGRKVGTIGDVGCFSFFGNKVLSTGEGGMCLTSSGEVCEKLKKLRDHGLDRGHPIFYFHDIVGYNYRMTNMQAALGVAQIERIDKTIETRQKIAKLYHSILEAHVRLPESFQDRTAVCWLFSCLLNQDVDIVRKELKQREIDSRPFFYPMSRMGLYSKYTKQSNENSFSLFRSGISLPTYIGLKENEVCKIANTLTEIITRM